MSEISKSTLESLRKVASLILDPEQPAYSLRSEVLELKAILQNASILKTNQNADIWAGEIQTSNGLAISPAMALMCIDDFVRTVEFIRGTHSAIVDSKNQFPDRPVRVLYAGCGPYAVLAVPIMATVAASDVVFSLVDIHTESVESARSIVNRLGLADHVASLETIDAAAYQVCNDHPPDVILLEILQAALNAEPQIAVTRHLVEQVPGAILIPEEIRIDLTLVIPSCEFNLEERGIKRDRIDVGPIFVVNREAVESWTNNDSGRLPGSILRIPESMVEPYQPMLFTNIRIYQTHILKDYNSGLTSPRILSIDGSIKPGDTIQFHYELGSRPRLIGEVQT